MTSVGLKNLLPVKLLTPLGPVAPSFQILRIVGVGGGGCNAVSRMYRESAGVVDYYCVNTDAQHLSLSSVTHRIPLGENVTRGLGAGGHPELGRRAAEESREALNEAVTGADMVFVTAGMGGGTGSGAAPVVAEIAKVSGALTIAVVSKPFSFEGSQRRRNAEEGIDRLRVARGVWGLQPKSRRNRLRQRGADLVCRDCLR